MTLALVRRIAGALKPGRIVIFHEYADCASWRRLPPRPSIERFVSEVMASWRAAGGEPDIARTLPALLATYVPALRLAVDRPCERLDLAANARDAVPEFLPLTNGVRHATTLTSQGLRA